MTDCRFEEVKTKNYIDSIADLLRREFNHLVHAFLYGNHEWRFNLPKKIAQISLTFRDFPFRQGCLSGRAD